MQKMNDKETIVKGENIYITIKGPTGRVTVDFSQEMMGTRKQWDHIFNVLKENNC